MNNSEIHILLKISAEIIWLAKPNSSHSMIVDSKSRQIKGFKYGK